MTIDEPDMWHRHGTPRSKNRPVPIRQLCVEDDPSQIEPACNRVIWGRLSAISCSEDDDEEGSRLLLPDNLPVGPHPLSDGNPEEISDPGFDARRAASSHHGPVCDEADSRISLNRHQTFANVRTRILAGQSIGSER